jgi:hypothetical protein
LWYWFETPGSFAKPLLSEYPTFTTPTRNLENSWLAVASTYWLVAPTNTPEPAFAPRD